MRFDGSRALRPRPIDERFNLQYYNVTDIIQRRAPMTQQITARLSDSVVEALDKAASHLRRSRAEVVRQAVEHYLEDFDDLSVAVERLRDPTGPGTGLGTSFGVTYSIRIKGGAVREIRRVAKPERARIVAAIDRLADNPLLGSALKGDLRGLRRLRVGDHRVLYEVRNDELIVLVIRTAHRRDAYRRKPA